MHAPRLLRLAVAHALTTPQMTHPEVFAELVGAFTAAGFDAEGYLLQRAEKAEKATKKEKKRLEKLEKKKNDKGFKWPSLWGA